MAKFQLYILVAILISWLIFISILEWKWLLKTTMPPHGQLKHGTQSHSQTITHHTNDDTICSLYIAPTSLPFDGYGIYTTRSFDISEIVAPPDSPSIPLIDIYAKNPHRKIGRAHV